MDKNLKIIDAIILNLNNLTVQGVRNMGLIIDSINGLDALRKNLIAQAEEATNVSTKTE